MFIVHVTSKDTEVHKFQALKLLYGTRISLDMTLEIRSYVKGHSSYGLKIFRENVKLFKGLVYQVSCLSRTDRSIRSRVILGKPERGGAASTPPVPERVKLPLMRHRSGKSAKLRKHLATETLI